MSNKKSIAFVLKTIGLEYDDRVRKEAIALSKVADVFIYVNFTDNRDESGVTSYSIPYRSFKLVTREKLPSAKYLLVKAFEFYLKVRTHLKKHDLVWSHEEYTFMFPLLLRKNRTIWDLHEIPFRFQSSYMKRIFRFIEKKSRLMIHANQERINYLTNLGVINNPEKHTYIRNFPDNDFLSSTRKDEKYENFISWLDGKEYAYLQGLTTPGRYPYNSIKSILTKSKLKIVIIGSVDQKELEELQSEFANEFSDRVFLIGMVDQLTIPNYLKEAELSIVLYNTDIPNNKFCEPNRLFNSICLGVPVLVGDNPPMKALVEKHGFGIALNSDGRDLEELEECVEKIIANKNGIKAQMTSKKKEILWNDKNVLEIVKSVGF